ncbi:MAG TPA: hypothetical protein VH817_01750 [Thermoleophilaceae bacterium]
MTRTVPLLVVLLAFVVWLPASAGAVTLPTDTTALLSSNGSFSPLPAPVSNSTSGQAAVSKDGRFVAFASTSDGLSNEDVDTVENVYVKDNQTGTVTLVSRRTGAAGAPATQDCFGAAISDNGRRVAFVCDGSLDSDDTNADEDVYLRDLDTNQTFLVSRASGLGAVGDDFSDAPALSQDGTHIAFESNATNLGGPTDRTEAIYVRDIALQGQPPTNGVTVVSRASGAAGALANDDSFSPSISNDGNAVAFASNAGNLVGDDNNNAEDVFVRTGTTTVLASRKDGAAGDVGNSDSDQPQISGDGNTVVFTSQAANLSTLDMDDGENIYKRSGTTTTLVDQVGGVPANNESVAPVVSDDGGTIAFVSLGSNLVAGDADADGGTFVATGGQISLVSGPNNVLALFGGSFPAMSGDGKEVLFAMIGSLTGDATPGVFGPALRVLSSGAIISVARPGQGSFDNQGGFTSGGSMSADGRFVAIASAAPALGVPGNLPDAIVVRDTVTGSTTLVSREDGPNGALMNAFVDDPQISADGRRVLFRVQRFFESTELWVRDLQTGRTMRVERADGPNGALADGFAFDGTMSADGSRVAFVTSADNLGDGDTDMDTDVHVRDLDTGRTILVSRANGLNGAKADNRVEDASISADGQHVAFSTDADNLSPDDPAPNNDDDIYVRDIGAGTTRLVSVATNGQKANSGSEDPTLSADGSRVAFDTNATNLGANNFNSTQVWVHDLTSGTTTLASRGGEQNQAGTNNSHFPIMSANGRVVIFRSEAPDFISEGLPLNQTEVYRHDIDADTTQLVSRGNGPNGAAVTGFVDENGLTADGSCVLFTGDGNLLGTVPGGDDNAQLYVRTFSANCNRPVDGPPAKDTTAPRLSSVSLTHTRFRVAKKSTAVNAKAHRKAPVRGTQLRFRTTEAGKLKIVIQRVLPGHKVRKGHKRICKPVRQRVHHGACTAFKRVGTLTRSVKSGRGKVSLSGRIGKRRMAAGRYRLTLTERDAAGNVSRAVHKTFTILPG